jgi:hypothetical protein
LDLGEHTKKSARPANFATMSTSHFRSFRATI